MLHRLVEFASPWLSDNRYFGTLRRLAARARKKSSAKFIGITGSSAKSTTAALLAHILAAEGHVHMQVQANILGNLIQFLASLRRGTDFVVAEVGVSTGAGRIKAMANLLRPDIAIVTLIRLEHKSIFRSEETIAAEKSELVAGLRPEGLAVLNADDPLVMAMAQRSRARVVTYGRSESAQYRAIDICSAFPERLSLKVAWAGGTLPLQTNFVGDHFWLPILAAVATAIELGVPTEKIVARLATFEPLFERCGVLNAPGGPTFILGTTKAPWHSVRSAIDVVAHATAPRKRIILGHLSDYTGSNQSKYRDFYTWARAASDQVLYVGEHAHRSMASQQDRDEGRFLSFATPLQVAEYIRESAIPGELILVKGSLDLHLERIALAWTKDVKCWAPSCGRFFGCIRCGNFEKPFEPVNRQIESGPRKRHRASLASVSRYLGP